MRSIKSSVLFLIGRAIELKEIRSWRFKKIHEPQRPDAWFYRVKGPRDYVFVHVPVVAGLYPVS